MTTSKTYSAIPIGTGAKLVTIECDSVKGLPTLEIIGMANKTIEESRERIRYAIRNSDFFFPSKGKITINLAPASLLKTGSHLDLPIAIAILAHSRQFPEKDTQDTFFIGELALNGQIRPVRGIINSVELALKRHFKRIVIPSANFTQASLIAPKEILIPVNNLRELWQIICEQHPVIHPAVVKNTQIDIATSTFDQIIGQSQAKRALTIAIAGHHNILLTGPPGTGKSLLASTIPSLLPPPIHAEIVELTKIQSLISDHASLCTRRPFRSPHHSASQAALLGNADGLPGEISLAHLGVLYLDELPEFRRDFLEALRQPLENKSIAIDRKNLHIKYPADFMLVGTMNPCPCGYYGAADHECACTPIAISNYQRKLSGPLLDRIDITINVPRVDASVLVNSTTTSTREHESAKRQISAALNKQFKRQRKTNANLSSFETVHNLSISPVAKTLLEQAASKLALSARAYFKTIKVAQTIADIDDSASIQPDHISEALNYRNIH